MQTGKRTSLTENKGYASSRIFNAIGYTFISMMPEDFNNLTTEELKNLLIAETSRFMQGVEKGLSFDDLKEIRIKLREIEAEIKRQESNH